MKESAKWIEFRNFVNSVKAERNRIVSWESTVQEATKPVDVTPSPFNTITHKSLEFVSKVTNLIFTILVKLPHSLFKLGYAIAILATKALSSIRHLWFVAK